MIDGCVSQLLTLMDTPEGWDDLGDNDGVQGGQKVAADGKQIIRSIGTINHTPEEVCAFIWDNSQKQRWDGMLAESTVVKNFNEKFKILYERFTAPWPVSHRDFVFACKIIDREDGILLVAKSMDAGVPEKSGVVRGEVTTSGFYLKRADAGATLVTYLVSVDPKGMLPGFIVNQLGKRQCLNINKIRHVMG